MVKPKTYNLGEKDYYPFGMGMPGRTWSVTSDDEYRFGFNKQEKINEISGSLNHNTALFWEYDTRSGRRWNSDPKPTASQSGYSVNKSNPVKYDDPNGDCPPGVDCSLQASVSVTFGTKDQSRVNLAVGFGVSKTSGSFMGAANLSLNLYNGGPGTTQASTGQNSLGGALTLGISGTAGNGDGRPTDLNLFNSSTFSGVTNNFNNSLSIGTNLTLNNVTGFNRAAGFSYKSGGFTVSLNEDFSLLKNGGPLASGKDEAETGGGFVGYTFKSGLAIQTGTEIFTGKPTSYPKQGDGNGYVKQEPFQQQLNVGRTFLKINNIQNFGNLRLDFSGQNQMWSQNAIHDFFGYDHFNSTAVNSFQLTH